MTNNEKAAIAAGLWAEEPCAGLASYCRGVAYCLDHQSQKYRHTIAAPDMHDPANLWEAFKRVAGELTFIPITDEAMFQALVALYKTKHPLRNG